MEFGRAGLLFRWQQKRSLAFENHIFVIFDIDELHTRGTSGCERDTCMLSVLYRGVAPCPHRTIQHYTDNWLCATCLVAGLQDKSIISAG